MKKILLVTTLFVLFFAGCKEAKTNNLEKKIVELEKMNKEKEKKIITLAVTVKVMSQNLSRFDHSGIWNFFNEKEFWETTYDVDPSTECRSNCAKNYQIANTHCQTIRDSTERLNCVNEAYRNLSNCTSACN